MIKKNDKIKRKINNTTELMNNQAVACHLKPQQQFKILAPFLQLMLSLPQVEACAVGLYGGFRLLAFVVASAAGDQMAASASSSVQERAEQTSSASAERQQNLPLSVKHHLEEAGGADGDLKRLILNQLSLLLPSHGIPDTLVLVPALCLTPHGERQTHAHS